LYVEKPEGDFSPERNYAVINDTIKDYEKMRYGVDNKVQENAANAADILTSWAKYKLDIGGGKQLEEWFGKENLARVYGEKLVEKLKFRDAIRKDNIRKGNTKLADFYLT
jgi:hypothetical protein